MYSSFRFISKVFNAATICFANVLHSLPIRMVRFFSDFRTRHLQQHEYYTHTTLFPPQLSAQLTNTFSFTFARFMFSRTFIRSVPASGERCFLHVTIGAQRLSVHFTTLSSNTLIIFDIWRFARVVRFYFFPNFPTPHCSLLFYFNLILHSFIFSPSRNNSCSSFRFVTFSSL